jgi:hypothetical protein
MKTNKDFLEDHSSCGGAWQAVSQDSHHVENAAVC